MWKGKGVHELICVSFTQKPPTTLSTDVSRILSTSIPTHEQPNSAISRLEK